MANKKNKQTATQPPVTSDEMMKLIKIIAIVVVIAIIFYLITIVITKYKKEKLQSNYNDSTPAIIQYDEIVLGSIFNQRHDEYYVLIMKEKEPYQELLSNYIRLYDSKEKSLKVYTSNLDSIFNKSYMSETSNLKTNNILEFRVSGLTLVKIKGNAVVEAYEGIDAIELAFKVLIK